MERSAIKNLGYFAEKNPPVTLVIICLLFFTISTCTLAYYTQHQSQLLDTDVLLNIYQLKKFINDLRVCIKPTGSNSINDQLVEKREVDEQVVISASVPIKNLDQLSSNVSLVQGLINLEDFHWSCPDSISPKYLEISFNTSDKLQDDNICVKLRGPRKLLKNLLTTQCQTSFKYQLATATLETKTPKSYGNFCENGTKVHFNFNRRENSERFAIFLSKEDQISVSETLLWCTYILVVICLLVIVIISFYTGESAKNIDQI